MCTEADRSEPILCTHYENKIVRKQIDSVVNFSVTPTVFGRQLSRSLYSIFETCYLVSQYPSDFCSWNQRASKSLTWLSNQTRLFVTIVMWFFELFSRIWPSNHLEKDLHIDLHLYSLSFNVIIKPFVYFIWILIWLWKWIWFDHVQLQDTVHNYIYRLFLK